MNMNETAKLNAFIDGELDAMSQYELEQRLHSDAPLAAQVESLRQLKQVVRDEAHYHRAPASLRTQLSAQTSAPSPVIAQTPRRAAAPQQRWLSWRPWASSLVLACLAVIILYISLWRSTSVERLQQEVIASHVRSTLGEHLLDVASTDRHTVKPWLSSRLGFSPNVQELGIPGSTLLGGRVDYLDGQPVASLVYRQGQHIVNAFVWHTGGADSSTVMSTERGFQLAHWQRSGMNHWVISDVNREEFTTLVRKLEAIDAP
jgi:anti-sigma factor RsiW